MEERYKKAVELHKMGLTYNEIADRLNIEKGAVTYILSSKGRKNMLKKQSKKEANKIFEENVLRVIPECNSINDICVKLGLKGVNWYYKKIHTIIDEYNVDTSHFGKKRTDNSGNFQRLSNEEYYTTNCRRNGVNLYMRLVQDGFKTHMCEKCGRDEWEGVKIPLQVHHKNGDHFDNRIENLELLCPNCHSLTDTFGKRKHNKEKKNKKEILSVEEITNDLTKEKEELIEAFNKYKSFVQVGKYYGVSDNAIRKRCKKLGILEIVKLIE